MARIHVVVAATSPDIEAEGIAAAVGSSVDMALVGGRAVPVADIEALLAAVPGDPPRVLVLVGPDDATAFAERRFLERSGLVVIRVNVPFGHMVRTTFNDIGLQSLLDQIRVLAGPHVAARANEPARGEAFAIRADGPLLRAGIAWIHATLRHAAARVGGTHGDLPGLTVAPSRVIEQLDERVIRAEPPADALLEADEALDRALAQAGDRDEPLATAVSTMALSGLELRVVLLALAPELDPHYQRCIGVLLDDLGRRVGTLGLCMGLLGEPLQVRFQLEASGHLARWRVFDGATGLLPSADEPLRLDPALVGWILGDDDALLRDPRVQRLFRSAPWPGVDLIDTAAVRARAAIVLRQLATPGSQWLLLSGDDAAGWQALLELGARTEHSTLLRLEGARVAALDADALEDVGIRIGRATLLGDRSLVVDLRDVEASTDIDDALRRGLASIGRTGCRAGLVSNDAPRLARLLGAMPFDRMAGPPLSTQTQIAAWQEAARGAGVAMSEEQAHHAMRRFALSLAGIDDASRLAAATTGGESTPEERLDRFMSACKQVASEGISRLAERVEPVFCLDDVVLPPDRKEQLAEIVDNVLLSERVLGDWAFGEQLPYGRGVTALFHGPSGTGKTMAALAVARRLGIQILRIDLSRVVSKYIGETEKNIDRVFEDAQRSGSALLIDEADALLGKRSEVKDAHDRYANIEVAYLLQRMEAYEGLAILTTNLRQNLDAAFLRRLRFVIDFPRPDADARERIWRHCLPARSHVLDDAAFRHLCRRVDLTGGHIRQITLRAAFIAAAADTKIDLSHIARATNAELAKLGMPPVQLETARQAA